MEISLHNEIDSPTITLENKWFPDSDTGPEFLITKIKIEAGGEPIIIKVFSDKQIELINNLPAYKSEAA